MIGDSGPQPFGIPMVACMSFPIILFQVTHFHKLLFDQVFEVVSDVLDFFQKKQHAPFKIYPKISY